MPGKYVLFLDDGGVMGDNRVRGPQWQRLVAEFFAPILGGSKEKWAEANATVIASILVPEAWTKRTAAATDYWSFERAYFIDWLRDMCELVGVSTPSEDESLALSIKATTWVTSQVRSDYPGVVDAIRRLYNADYLLYTASGEASTDLRGYLGNMGVRECFVQLYGPDLINTLKAGTAYYERIFADSGVAPADALVVDDSYEALGWAAKTGANTAHITKATPPGSLEGGVTFTASSLEELASLLLTD